HPVQPAPHPAPHPAPSPSRIIDPGASAEVAAQPHDGLYIIKSPIVGTFYASPGPEAPPFVKVGDDVQPGKVLCIIEAMKLMNEIEAEVTGEIAKVFVESGKPVEYGQALFGLIPAAS
ncbi:MAG: acetyl-CoA carboxylase biotin carboxyl carrier protein, partial [Terriglobia bacterium]